MQEDQAVGSIFLHVCWFVSMYLQFYHGKSIFSDQASLAAKCDRWFS
ncbi:unnamed protein product [Amoebophrya sp. A25]|nr:unnamed protein product [Amoebophrya sp. A25]|eukprot:GSA25T00013475001.1